MLNLKKSVEICYERLLLDLYRYFGTFALTVWVIQLSGQITQNIVKSQRDSRSRYNFK